MPLWFVFDLDETLCLRSGQPFAQSGALILNNFPSQDEDRAECL